MYQPPHRKLEVEDPTALSSLTEADAVAAIIESAYGIDPVVLEPIDRGKDFAANAYVARGRDGAPTWLVKARQATAPRDVAVTVARYLADTGVPGVVAPIRARDGRLSIPGAGLTVAVYPFIDGRLGIEMDVSDAAWRALGRFARRLHDTVLPEELDALMPRESYRPPDGHRIGLVDAAVAEIRQPSGPVAAVVDVWREHRAEILELDRRATGLGDALRTRSLPLVVCHADMHTGNLIVNDDDVWIIDWDEVVLAPKERDLMFSVGGGISTELVSPNATARFVEGYGRVDIDDDALAYYRHSWAVQDVGGYAWRVMLDESATETDRADAAAILAGLFRPGEIVELARNSVHAARRSPSASRAPRCRNR